MSVLNTIDLGTFEVRSDKMVVSDPGYLLKHKESIILHVVKGIWQANVRKKGETCRSLTIYHQDFRKGKLKFYDSTSIIDMLTGKAGFFDKPIYNNNKYITGLRNRFRRLIPKLPWFALCCQKSVDKPGAGVILGGVVSASDNYNGELFTITEDNLVVAAKLVFMEKDDD